MPTPKFTTEILAAAIEGFEQQKLRIDAQIAELRAMMTGGTKEFTAASTSESIKPARKKISASTRKRIGDAVRKAFLAKKAAKSPSQAVTPLVTKPVTHAKKAKRKISAEGRRRIIEANQRMWATKRALAAKARSAVAKKVAPKKAVVKKAATK
jgi:hypothetical protein